MYYKRNKIVFTVISIMVCLLPHANATPAFARQMSMDCMSCHYQNIPKLNSFGRSFKLSGFTMMSTLQGNSIESPESGKVSIPSALNIAFVTKARHINSKTAKGTTEIFDEAALLFGGRVSDTMGTSMEFTSGLVGGKFLYSEETLGGRLGVAYYMTDGLGAFTSTETYTTGLYRAVRQFENRNAANIFQKTGIGSGAATGINTYYSGHSLYATLGLYVPAYGNSIDTDSNFKMLARAAYEFTIAGHQLSIGGYYLGGDISSATSDINASAVVADLAKFAQTSYGFDMQSQGNIASMPLMITLGYVISNTNTAKTVDESGFSIATQLNLTSRFGVKIAFLAYNDNVTSTNSESDISGGLEFNARQNIRLVLEYSTTMKNSISSDKILFMSHIAF